MARTAATKRKTTKASASAAKVGNTATTKAAKPEKATKGKAKAKIAFVPTVVAVRARRACDNVAVDHIPVESS